jgi:hypothetical protein
MKAIKKDELFGHLSQFLKSRGVEIKEGSYAESIQKGCSILTDTINLSQKGLEVAKTQIDKQVEVMRQVIHEHTAPRTQTAKPAPKAGNAGGKKKASAKIKQPAKASRKNGRAA